MNRRGPAGRVRIGPDRGLRADRHDSPGPQNRGGLSSGSDSDRRGGAIVPVNPMTPVLPENAEDKPHSRSRGRVAPGSELKPHEQAVLERLKQRDRERRR
jgi:hypothetical protein